MSSAPDGSPLHLAGGKDLSAGGSSLALVSQARDLAGIGEIHYPQVDVRSLIR
jgi:hypothetical protein